MTKNYSARELDHYFKDMKDDITEIRAQTTKTNGRVTSLEGSRIQMWTAVGLLTVLGGAIITLSVMAIDNKIKNGIDQAFTTRFDNIQVQ